MSHHYCEYEDDDKNKYVYIKQKRRTSKEILVDLKKERQELMKELREQKCELAFYKKDIKRLEKNIKKISDNIKNRI